MLRPLVLLVLLPTAALRAAAPVSAPAADFAKLCASCHGARGEGREDLRTPSIANEPWWYVKTQLGNFHEGRRGVHALQDPQGPFSRPFREFQLPKPGNSGESWHEN